MHNVLMSSFVPVLADNMFLNLWNGVWPYLMMMAGFSVIVFVHELGHFAVAKWADVRVERFAIGFGRELIGFTRGETRYSFNLLPLGGYVKMLGQEDFDDKGNELKFKEDPRSFASKPVGHRAAIVSAGVIMNVLFAFFLFMIVFLVGMNSTAPRIAFVEPDSPAERAGLLPGDLVKEINGQSIKEFNEIRMAVMLAPKHEPINVIVEREGVDRTVPIRPEYRKPRSTRDVQRQVIGIAPGVTPEILGVGPEIDTSRADRPHVGDKVVEVAGVEVTKANANQIYQMLAYSEEDVVVERKDPKNPDAEPQRVTIKIPPVLSLYPSELGDTSTVSVLGLTPLVRISGVDPRGRAHVAGLKTGDTILSLDDKPYPDPAMIARAIRHNAERDIHFRVRTADQRVRTGFLRPKSHDRGAATLQAVIEAIPDVEKGEPRTRFGEVRSYGAAAAGGIEPGDVILSINGNDDPSLRTVTKVIGSMSGKPVVVTVKSAAGTVSTKIVTPVVAGAADASFSLVAEDVMQTGRVLQTINGKPSPAATAGVPDSVAIVSVNGERMARWRDLIAAFARHAGGTVDLTYREDRGPEQTVAIPVPHSIRTTLGVGPASRIVTIDGSDTVVIDSKAGGQRVSIGYHEGLRRRLEELVGQKNVPIEYRGSVLGELQTAHIDITEDMVDPWLGRVQFSPNVAWGEEQTLLKGENVIEAVGIGVHKTYYFVLQVLKTMERMIFTRTVGVESMSGPLGIIDIGGKFAQSGFVKFLFFMAIISANLAVINFLPLPIVDGGLMVFLIIEKIKGSPVSLRVQVATQMIGLFLILGAFVFVTYQDALRLWG